MAVKKLQDAITPKTLIKYADTLPGAVSSSVTEDTGLGEISDSFNAKRALENSASDVGRRSKRPKIGSFNQIRVLPLEYQLIIKDVTLILSGQPHSSLQALGDDNLYVYPSRI